MDKQIPINSSRKSMRRTVEYLCVTAGETEAREDGEFHMHQN